MLKSRFQIALFCVHFMATPPTPPTKTLTATGPIIIVILIIAAAFIGYYQIVVYPTVAPTSTSTAATTITPTAIKVSVTIPQGSASNPSKGNSFYYQPDSITVYIGYNSTVIWRNNDSAAHTVTAAPGSPDPRFNAFGPTNQPYNNINANQEVNFTFSIPGTYNYSCSYHTWMKGEVIVKTAPPGLLNSTSSGSQTGSSANSITSSAASLIDSGVHAGGAWAIDFARSLAILIGSGIAPWSVNLSISLSQLVWLIPADLT